jgi:hypothetical protein
MARLFITPRELNFISDVTKELIKDVVGQRVFLYPISEIKTKTSSVYNEALKKVFDNPIILDCLVDTHFQTDTKTDQYGVDATFKIEVYLQYRDLVDKNISLAIGDFFSFSDVFYEVAEKVFMRNIYGMPEHKDGVKLIGTKARDTQFKAITLGPTDIARPDPGAVQTTFVQQRGQPTSTENINGQDVTGPTGDIRDLQNPNILGAPITGAKEVSPLGDSEHSGQSSFYDDE